MEYRWDLKGKTGGVSRLPCHRVLLCSGKKNVAQVGFGWGLFKRTSGQALRR